MHPTKDIHELLEKIRSNKKELDEIEHTIQNKNLFRKIFSNGIDLNRKDHLAALIQNQRISLEVKLEDWLAETDPEFKKLVDENMEMLASENFELKFTSKSVNIDVVAADLSDLPQHYQPVAGKFVGTLFENGKIDYAGTLDKSGEYSQPLNGVPTLFKGKIDFKGSTYLHVVATETRIVEKPFKYAGHINKLGEITLESTTDTAFMTGGFFMPDTLTGTFFESNSAKTRKFFSNKTKAMEMVRKLKFELLHES